MLSGFTVSVGFSFVPVTMTASVAASERPCLSVPSLAVIDSSASIVSSTASWGPS